MTYAYRFDVHPELSRSTLCEQRGVPDTGWVHVHVHHDQFYVVTSEDQRVLGQLRVPGTHIEPYHDDELTIDFYDAWPTLKPPRMGMTVHEWLRSFGNAGPPGYRSTR